MKSSHIVLVDNASVIADALAQKNIDTSSIFVPALAQASDVCEQLSSMGITREAAARLVQYKIDTLVLGRLQTNVYVLVAGDECMVIDPGAHADRIVEYVTTTYPNAVISKVVATHGHGDHIGAIEELLTLCEQTYGTRPEYSISLFDHLLSQDIDLNMGKIFNRHGVAAPAADKTFGEGDTLCLDDFEMKVMATPGHTFGSCCFYHKTNYVNQVVAALAALAASVYFGDEDQTCKYICAPIAFVGDTIFPSSAGRTDTPSGNADHLNKTLIRLIADLDPETLLLPGHGATTYIEVETETNPALLNAIRLSKFPGYNKPVVKK